MDIFSASDKATYDRRKQMVAEQWAEYEEDKNPGHLAAICRDYSSSIMQMSVKKSRAYFWLIYTRNWINCQNPVRKIFVLRC